MPSLPSTAAPKNDLADYCTALTREYVALAAKAAPLTGRMDEIKTELRALLPAGPSEFAGQRVTLSPTPVFDAKAFEAAYPESRFPQFYKEVLDRAAIDRKIAADDLALFMKQGTPKVTFK